MLSPSVLLTRPRRALHTSLFRHRSILLMDAEFNILRRFSREAELSMAYRPQVRPGCRVLRRCLLVGDGLPRSALLIVGTRGALLISMPAGTLRSDLQLLLVRVLHDWKLPIRLVTESVNTLSSLAFTAQGALQYQLEQPLQTVLSGCQNLLNLIDNLSENALSFASIQAPNRQRCDLVARMRSLCIQMMPIAMSRGVKLHFRANVPFLYALVDPELMNRLALNLLSNSFKHTPEGGVVQMRLDLTSDTQFQLSVTDSGSGIPPDILARVFDRFVTARDHGAGSGLGLPNVKAIAQQHGGCVRLESALGQGTRVEVDLPTGTAQTSGAKPVLPPPKPLHPSPPDKRAM